MQNQINEMQNLYREWLALHEKLVADQANWQRSHEIMQQLKHFYFDGQYQDFHEQIENDAHVDLTTQGEYSIMAEDTIWNAFHDQQNMAWQRIRSAMAVLDPNNESFLP